MHKVSRYIRTLRIRIKRKSKANKMLRIMLNSAMGVVIRQQKEKTGGINDTRNNTQ